MLTRLLTRSGAQRTLDLAIEGLTALGSDEFWLDFNNAVTILAMTKGSIITTGVGKSGHVARKVSSTLVSLNAPSFHLHAAEAGHGDLGMVRAEDTILAFSHSGETQELEAVASHASWLDCPSIVVSSARSSRLVQRASCAVIYPRLKEGWGQAPTTSSTQQLVIGDMLAVAIAELRGVTCEQFARNHPGGAIGTSNA